MPSIPLISSSPPNLSPLSALARWLTEPMHNLLEADRVVAFVDRVRCGNLLAHCVPRVYSFHFISAPAAPRLELGGRAACVCEIRCPSDPEGVTSELVLLQPVCSRDPLGELVHVDRPSARVAA